MGKLLVLGTSVLFLTLLFGGFTFILGDLQNNYGFISQNNYSELNDAFNYTTAQSLADAQQNELNSGLNQSFDLTQVGLLGGAFSFIDTAFKSIGNAVKPFTTIGDKFGTMITSLGSVFGIPAWVISMFVTIIVLALLIFIGGILANKEW